MRKVIALSLISWLALTMAACSVAEPKPPQVALLPERAPAICAWPKDQEPPSPSACPPGCVRDGDVCKQQRGIIVHESNTPVEQQSTTTATLEQPSLWDTLVALFASPSP